MMSMSWHGKNIVTEILLLFLRDIAALSSPTF